jgi:hypothetical protein
MKSSRLFVSLLLIVGIASASFNVVDYLYSKEPTGNVTYEKFSLNSTNYSIVRISGKECFLLKNNEPVLSLSEIEAVLDDYNIMQYYPTDAELANVLDLLKKYNISKNNGEVSTQPGKEEASCRYATFIDGHVKVGTKPVQCIDDESCKQNALLFYSAYGQALGLGSYTTILQPLTNFSYASYGSQRIMNQSFEKMDSIDRITIYDNLLFIQNSIPALRGYEADIEKSVFRFPKLSDPKDVAACKGVCYGICPPLSFDGTILNKLEANVTVLVTRVSNLGTKSIVANRIFNETFARIEGHSKDLNATYYSSLYLPLHSKAISAMSFADYTLVRVKNSSLTTDVSSLRALHEKINTSIANRDFSTIDADLVQYSSLISQVKNSSQEVFSIYNDSAASKNRADLLLFILESRDLDPLLKSDEQVLKAKILSLDSVFNEGLSQNDYTVLGANYTAAAAEGAVILRNSRSSAVSISLLSFRSFAHQVNHGLAAFIASTGLMQPRDVPKNKVSVFGGFSLLSLLSFGSMGFLMFLGVLMVSRSAKRSVKYVFLAIFFIALLSASAFSVFLYVYLDRTSSNAEAEEYLTHLSYSPSADIFVDLTSAPAGGKESIAACGASIAGKLRTTRNVTLYAIESAGCTRNSSISSTATTITDITKSSCQDMLANSSIALVLNYSAKFEQPVFSTVFIDRAFVNADSSYYDTCPLSSIFE